MINEMITILECKNIPCRWPGMMTANSRTSTSHLCSNCGGPMTAVEYAPVDASIERAAQVADAHRSADAGGVAELIAEEIRALKTSSAIDTADPLV